MQYTRPALLVAAASGWAIIASFGVAHAGTADGQDGIVVEGHGLADTPSTQAYDAQLIDRDALLSVPSGRIEDALSSVAGFQQFRRSDSRSSNPSAQGVTLRALGGNATSRTLVLLDGVPMADPFFGYIPLSAIATERLGAARVIRGGGAGPFGSGAVAGTIELFSASAGDLGPVNAGLIVNDRGETELSGVLAPQLGAGFATIGARWDRGKGFYTTPISQRVPATARARYDSWSISPRAVVPLLPDVELQARALVYDDNRVLRFDGAQSSSQGQDVSIRLVGHGAWKFDMLAYYQQRDFSNIVISSSSFTKVLDQYKTPTSGAGGKLELRPPLASDVILRIGMDWRITKGNAQEVAYNGRTGDVTARRRVGGRNSSVGFFVENDLTLGRLVLTAGARADRWSIGSGRALFLDGAGAITGNDILPARSGWEGTFRAGAHYGLGNGWSVRVAGYRGFRMPTLNELYRQFTVFPVTTLANPALENEKLRGFDGGVEWAPSPDIRFTATAFDDKVRNAIANVTLDPTKRERQNVGAIHTRGLELSARLKTGPVSFDGSLAWTDAEVESDGLSAALDGNRPAQTPRIAASATLGWQPEENWKFALTVRHTGAQYEDDQETDVLKSATTLGAFAQMPVSPRVSLELRGENLTDTKIMTRNQSGSIDLGTPRTIWIGARIGGF